MTVTQSIQEQTTYTIFVSYDQAAQGFMFDFHPPLPDGMNWNKSACPLCYQRICLPPGSRGAA